MAIRRCRKSLSRRATRQRRCQSQPKGQNKPELDYRCCRHNRGRSCVGGFFLSRRGTVAAALSRSQAPCSSPARCPAPRLLSASVPEKSIAVLPFENLSDDKAERLLHRRRAGRNFDRSRQDRRPEGDQPHLGDAVQDGRAAQPARDRPSSSAWRTWSKAVSNGRAIEVRVNAQLIDARNDAHLWAQTYDRDLADVFAIQSEIAKAIADQLQAKLSPAREECNRATPDHRCGCF